MLHNVYISGCENGLSPTQEAAGSFKTIPFPISCFPDNSKKDITKVEIYNSIVRADECSFKMHLNQYLASRV